MIKNDAIVSVLTRRDCFTAAECASIVNLVAKRRQLQGIARGEYAAIRDSQVAFIPRDGESDWIFARIQALFTAANERFRFHLSGFNEPLQVAEYESGGQYNWHLDIGADVTSTRKMSVSVQLTDGDSYEGGELEFMNVKVEPPRSAGAVIIFPAYLPHRVRPVTRGIRRSLVAWIHGNPFS